MVKRVLLIAAFILLAASPALATNGIASGDCELGGRQVTTSGLGSTTRVQQSFPSCTVTVYLTSSTTLATLYSDNLVSPTVLANPFTATSTGAWKFYAASGRYDVIMSGGLNGGFPSPRTLTAVSVNNGVGTFKISETSGSPTLAVGDSVAASTVDFTKTGVAVAETFTSGQNPTGINADLRFNPTSPSTAESSAIIGIQYWGGSAVGSTGAGYGIQGGSYWEAETPSTATNIIGLNSIAGAIKRGSTSTGTLTNAYGLSVLMYNSGGGTITNAYGVHTQLSAVNVSTSSFTNSYHLYVGPTGINTSATVVNDYGLYITDRATATTLNYAIYTNIGAVHFGDSVTITSGTMTVPTGTTSTPSYTFVGATTTGMFYTSGVGFTTGGVLAGSFRLVSGVGRLAVGAHSPLFTIDARGGNYVFDGTTGTIFVTAAVGSTATGSALNTTSVGTVGAADFSIRRNSSDRIYVEDTITSIIGSGVQLDVMTTPSAPAASKVRIYADTSGGKVRLRALFPSGASQAIATEP